VFSLRTLPSSRAAGSTDDSARAAPPGDRDRSRQPEPGIRALQDEQGHRDDLGHGLRLAQGRGRDHAALTRRRRAQQGDEQLAREDHDHHPRRDHSFLDEHDQD